MGGIAPRQVPEIEIFGDLRRRKHNLSDVQISGFENDAWTKQTGAPGSTFAFDTDCVEGLESLKITANTWIIMQRTVSIDIRKRSIGIALKASNVALVNYVSILFYDAAGNYIKWAIHGESVWLKDIQQWQYVVCHPGDATTVSGTPDYAHITRVEIQVGSSSGSLDVYVDDLFMTQNLYPGVMVYSFDDQLLSIYQSIAPALKAAGIRGCLNVRPANIGTTGYMTAAMIRELHDDGWDITVHGYNHPLAWHTSDGLTRRTELVGGKEALRAIGVSRGLEYFTLPYGDWSVAVLPEIKENYRAALATQDRLNAPNPKQSVVYRHTADGYTLAQAKSFMDKVKANGGVFIMLLHAGNVWLPDAIAYQQSIGIEAVTLTDLFNRVGCRI